MFKAPRKRTFCLTLCLLGALFSHHDAKSDFWDQRVLPTFSRGFDPAGFAIIGAGGISVALTQPLDYQTQAAFVDHQRLSEENSEIGDTLGTGIPGALIAITQLFMDYENGIAHADALVLTGVTTLLLKVSNKRNRPSSANRWSMPSGHTSTAFASATALTYAYGFWAAVPAYSLATLVAVSRLSDNAHWLSDTVAGATVGLFWGRATASKSSTNQTTWLPLPLEDGLFLSMRRAF
jgi:membrane-associated phospholipid phosphatase